MGMCREGMSPSNKLKEPKRTYVYPDERGKSDKHQVIAKDALIC